MITVAGGVVWNPKKGVVVVNQNNDSWSLPKGHTEHDESPFQTALREIMEETGLEPETLVLLRPLGSYTRAQIKRHSGDIAQERTITMFFFRTDAESLAPRDPENPEARWVNPVHVAELLTHEKDKAFFATFFAHAPEFNPSPTAN
jgi:8-oxo-dGTP pyrophosphatase MutT (NUDIX family)